MRNSICVFTGCRDTHVRGGPGKSRCVKDLPKNADGGPTVWDLRQLVLEGESTPVAGDVVQRYLDLTYSRIDSARGYVPSQSLEETRPLLTCADAVSSSDVIHEQLDHSLLNVSGLCLNRGVDEAFSVQLRLRERIYTVSSANGLREWKVPVDDNSVPVLLLPSRDAQFGARSAAIQAAVSTVLEEWMYLADRTRMTKLARVLLGFVKTQLVPYGCGQLVEEGLRGLYSPRALQCMPHELLYEALVRDCLMVLPSRISLAAKGVSAKLATPAVLDKAAEHA
ncbi:hypothetical protein GPECTOR_4g594 [Gonium pectorale]|uniref:Uncharacterized protein n=1 Tax=Gonium pectorale TaxID=33097 RepID=A0A150GXH8_GONPE|nr:hypothetical protein GPECTOR_4g594 [Gonium pectorale]|eukprot:KXZ54529.1 hypothetical protein GPECTOR_4g594 [Gonium pectorale]